MSNHPLVCCSYMSELACVWSKIGLYIWISKNFYVANFHHVSIKIRIFLLSNSFFFSISTSNFISSLIFWASFAIPLYIKCSIHIPDKNLLQSMHFFAVFAKFTWYKQGGQKNTCTGLFIAIQHVSKRQREWEREFVCVLCLYAINVWMWSVECKIRNLQSHDFIAFSLHRSAMMLLHAHLNSLTLYS